MLSPERALATEAAREVVEKLVSRVHAATAAATWALASVADVAIARVAEAAHAKSLVAVAESPDAEYMEEFEAEEIDESVEAEEIISESPWAESVEANKLSEKPESPNASIPKPPRGRPAGSRPSPGRLANQSSGRAAKASKPPEAPQPSPDQSSRQMHASILETQPATDFRSDFPSTGKSRRLPKSDRAAHLDVRAELERDRELLRSRYMENMRQTKEMQREPTSARRMRVRDFVQVRQDPSGTLLQHGEESIPHWIQERIASHQQRKRHLRVASSTSTFGGSSSSTWAIPRPQQSAPPKPPAVSPSYPTESTSVRGDQNGIAVSSLGDGHSAPLLSVLESVDVAMKIEDAKVPESVLDEHGITAFFDAYKAAISLNRRPDEDAQPSSMQPEELEDLLPQAQDSFAESRRAESGHSIDLAKSASKMMQPGLVAYQSPKNPWHWPRRGGVPPMESAVVALLKGKPPPIQASPEEALAARQELNLPVIQKVKQVALWPDPAAKAQPKKGRERHIKASPGLK